MAEALALAGVDAPLPGRRVLPVGPGPRRRRVGAWPAGWPSDGGVLVSPGEFYGPAGAGHVRVAVVQPDDRIALVADRLRAGVS